MALIALKVPEKCVCVPASVPYSEDKREKGTGLQQAHPLWADKMEFQNDTHDKRSVT